MVSPEQDARTGDLHSRPDAEGLLPQQGGDSAPLADQAFRALVELSPDAILVIVDGYHAFANARAIALLGGRTLDDLRSRPAVEFMHPEIRDTALRRMDGIVAAGTSLDYVEERIVRLDGSVIDIEAAGTPIRVGSRIGALVCIRDITTRKQAEAKLAAAQERFSAAFRHAPSGMAIVDSAGAILDANPALGAMVGIDPAELLGRPMTSLVRPDDRRAAATAISRLRQGAPTARRGQLRFSRQDGSSGWMALSAASLAGSDAYVVHALDISEQKQAEAALTQRALHDPLTGLANRRAILDALDAAVGRTHGNPVTVLFIDLDGFKRVNDTLGHAAGDMLLREVAARLAAAVRPTDLVGRLGGDEFAVVLHDAVPGSAIDVGLRIENAVAEPFRIGEHVCHVTASVGSARDGRDGTTSGELLAAADAGMYQAKAARRERAPVGRSPGEDPPR